MGLAVRWRRLLRCEPGSRCGDLGDREYELEMERCFRFRGTSGVLERWRLARPLVKNLSARSCERDGDRDLDLLVEMVETDSESDSGCEGSDVGDRRLSGFTSIFARLASASASCWSATPLLIVSGQYLCGEMVKRTYLFNKLSGVSLANFGLSLGFNSCCVREGLEAYGRSCVLALHS